MSVSIKPRLAGRQPSNRGGVPRVMTRLSSRSRLQGKRGSEGNGPPDRQGNLTEASHVYVSVNPPCQPVVIDDRRDAR